MTARDTRTDKPARDDPRARGVPHFFVRRSTGGRTCSVCGELWDSPIHKPTKPRSAA